MENREFWISEGHETLPSAGFAAPAEYMHDQILDYNPGPGHRPKGEVIHVIEYAAVEQLREENENRKFIQANLQLVIDKHQQELSALRKDHDWICRMADLDKAENLTIKDQLKQQRALLEECLKHLKREQRFERESILENERNPGLECCGQIEIVTYHDPIVTKIESALSGEETK